VFHPLIGGTTSAQWIMPSEEGASEKYESTGLMDDVMRNGRVELPRVVHGHYTRTYTASAPHVYLH